jgi:hypothetical protein
MKKSIKFLLAAFVVTVAASCSKPNETSDVAADTTVVETPAVEETPADTTATTDTTAVQ